MKEEANKNAFKKLEIQASTISSANADKKTDSTPSQRYDGKSRRFCLLILISWFPFSIAPASILEVNDAPWTGEEQQLLEQAMKTYPASHGVERWDMIADCIPNRSRTDCIKRYKHLVELVKAKNAAKAKTAAAAKK